MTPVDIGILELKSAVENLEAAIDRIQDQIDELSTSALLLIVEIDCLTAGSQRSRQLSNKSGRKSLLATYAPRNN